VATQEAAPEATEVPKPRRARKPKATAETTSAAPAVTANAGTDYVILERVEVEGEALWRVFKTQPGTQKESALKAATKMDDQDAQRPGAYKAVPLSNWKGGKVYENEVKPVTKASDLDD
jgi:hypothetical protein